MPCHSHREERTIALDYHYDDSEIEITRHLLGEECTFIEYTMMAKGSSFQ